MLRAVLSRILHAAALFVLVFALARGINAARHLRRLTPDNCIEFVSSRKPDRREAGWEEWRHGDTVIRIDGLAQTEFDPRRLPPWRHALAPATSLTLSPHAEPITLLWEFSNLVSGQHFTARLGPTLLQEQSLDRGNRTGQFTIPPATEPLRLSFEFSSEPDPHGDPRPITVTFWTLRAVFP